MTFKKKHKTCRTKIYKLKMENSLHELNSKLHIVKEKISDLGNITIKMILTEAYGEKRMKGKTPSVAYGTILSNSGSKRILEFYHTK